MPVSKESSPNNANLSEIGGVEDTTPAQVPARGRARARDRRRVVRRLAGVVTTHPKRRDVARAEIDRFEERRGHRGVVVARSGGLPWRPTKLRRRHALPPRRPREFQDRGRRRREVRLREGARRAHRAEPGVPREPRARRRPQRKRRRRRAQAAAAQVQGRDAVARAQVEPRVRAAHAGHVLGRRAPQAERRGDGRGRRPGNPEKTEGVFGLWRGLSLGRIDSRSFLGTE
jgi:hypothetical protein